MLVITINIRAGGGKQVGALLAFLDRFDPHTVVLTEWRDNAAGARIAGWARARGMHFGGLTDGGTANGVFLASKAAFSVESRRPAEPGAGVLMLARFRAFSILACYFPLRKEKALFFARCADVAAENACWPLLLLGDLNTGNQIVDKDIAGGRYHCSADFDGLSLRHGLLDLWRRTHGSEAREWTWLSGRLNGFCIDHAFANPAFVAWASPVCRYEHGSRGSVTDHSAVIVECMGGALLLSEPC